MYTLGLILLGIILAIIISYSVVLFEKIILIIKNKLLNFNILNIIKNLWRPILIGIVIGTIVNTIFALNPAFNRTSSPKVSPNIPTHAYCFDYTGMPRCPLLVPLPPGTPCYCPYQGAGYAGYLVVPTKVPTN